MAATYPADTFQEGVDLTIEASNQLAQVVRGDANTEVMVADGSTIPSIRKAQADSMYFKEPEAWITGQTETDYLQLKRYIDPTTGKESWWFAKGAMASNPIAMGTSPFGDDNWTLYTPEDLFISGKAEYESVYQALKGKAAEAGYNLVRGSFEEGAVISGWPDVVWCQTDGKYYQWHLDEAKTVPAGSTPETTGGIGAGAWVSVGDARSGAEERLLGVGAKIYRGSNEQYVQNGDVVPVGTTHLRVLINGKVETVAMSPVASGVVSLLTETSATIGSTPVAFSNVGFKQFPYLYNSSGDLVVDGAVALGDRISVENYYQDGTSGILFFRVVAASTGTADGGKYIDLPSSGLQLEQNLKNVIDVRHFGAKCDYYIDGLVNSSPTDDSEIINKTYVYCVTNGFTLGLYGSIYIEDGLRFSTRAGLNRKFIDANCTLYANINNQTKDLPLGDELAAAALYIGDDTSNGVYELKIRGNINTINVGAKRVLNEHGVVIQSAAHGQYELGIIDGFDIGCFAKGVILATLDFNMRQIKNCNLDVCLETNQSGSGGILRHTNNQITVQNVILGSAYKVAVQRASESNVTGFNSSGSNIRFINVDLEGNNYSALTYHRQSSAIYVDRAAEVQAAEVMFKIKFDTVWYEAFYKAIPMLVTNSTVLFENLTITSANDDYVFEVTDKYAKVILRDSNIYFGDGEPNFLMKEHSSRACLVMDNTAIYGENDGTGPTHFYDYSSTALGTTVYQPHIAILGQYEQEIEFNGLGRPTDVYTGRTNEYMTNAVLDMKALVADLFNEYNYLEAVITIAGSDGVGAHTLQYKLVSSKLAAVKVVVPIIENAFVTLSGTTLTWDGTLRAGWHRPTCRVSIKLKNSSLNSIR